MNLSKYRYTIDIIEDFKLFMSIVEKKNFLNLRMIDIINFIDKNPDLVKYQKNIKRNFGWNHSLKLDKQFRKKNEI